ncbi:MAG: Maf family protein [Brevinema sp.]
MKNIILASGSEGRRELFEREFEEFEVIVSGCEEDDLLHLPPKEMVQALAERKAQSISKDRPHDFVCAFDTMVECEGQVLGKPVDLDDARKMFEHLNNKEQIVWTGYAIAHEGELFSGVDHAVLVLQMDQTDIDHYIQTHPVTRFAGGYAIQKKDTNVIVTSGSMDTIIGAPMHLVIDFINKNR